MTKFFTSPCLNPFVFEGRSVNMFYVFKDGEVVASSRWFGSNNPYRWIEFPFDIKLKRIKNLESKDAFYITNNDNYSCGKMWDIYIPASLLSDFETKENIKGWENDTTTNYHDEFSFKLYGEKRHPQKNESGEIEWVYSEGTWTAGDTYNHRFEDTDFGSYVKEMHEQLTSERIEITSYDLERLLKSYELKKK